VSLLPRDDVRASDLDRERAVEFLKAHYADGRLGPDELAWRTEAAYRAVGLAELDRLTADLPALAPRARRGRSLSMAPFALAAVLVVAVLLVVPPETWLVLIVVGGALAFLAAVMVAPIAVPLLFLAWIAHLTSRATRSRPRPPAARVGWR